eukprot:scaffold2207_cov70-Phaeocystis_antarctica.AAC.3
MADAHAPAATLTMHSRTSYTKGLQLAVLLRQHALRREQRRLTHLRPVRLSPRRSQLRLHL